MSVCNNFPAGAKLVEVHREDEIHPRRQTIHDVVEVIGSVAAIHQVVQYRQLTSFPTV